MRDRNRIGVTVNVVSKAEYVKPIERFHCLLEERERYSYAILPFLLLPKIIVAELIVIVSFYINTFVQIVGVSQVFLPIFIIEGVVLDYKYYFRIIFREYLQTYKGMRNNITSRTIDTLVLGPNENRQKGICYYSFATD